MSHTPIPSDILSLVEETTLPQISVRVNGLPTFRAYVNAYVVGSKRVLLTNGTARTPLYYLSLVARRGEGTTLQGIFSTLVSTHLKEVTLEGVGEVALAHHQLRLTNLGYTLHWNFEQAEVQPSRDLHAVIESNMLTMCDPVRGLSMKQRFSRTANEQVKRQKETASLSTAKTSKSQNSIEDIRHREQQPLFLLLVPGTHQNESSFVHQLHLSFLDLRVPWPLDPSWASYLWQRGLDNGEIEPLTVWCGAPPTITASNDDTHHDRHNVGNEDNGDNEDQAERKERMEERCVEDDQPQSCSAPFLAQAYFCRPQPALLQQDIQQAVRTRQFSSRQHTHLVVLPSSRESSQEDKETLPVAVNE